jgi:hypothetical protein
VFLCVAGRRDGRHGMSRRLASRTPVFHCPPTLHCSKWQALVLGMFSHYLLFDPE